MNRFDINDLLLQCAITQSNNSIFTLEDKESYKPFDNSNINNLNTYNIIRQLYRDRYDLRSKGKVIENDIIYGQEINPFTNTAYKINYLNDFSISAQYNIKDIDFIRYILIECPKSRFAFLPNQIHENILQNRVKTFYQLESIKSDNNTTDFFSYKIQVNPLLYAYMDIDAKDGSVHIMDSDLFLELDRYSKVFNIESYTMKGNQLSNLLWFSVTDTSSSQKNIYDSKTKESIGFENVYQNGFWLLKDTYTNKLIEALSNSNKYYQINSQNDFNKNNNINNIKTEEDTRGHLFYDDLLEIVFKRIENYINNDSNKPDKIDKIFNDLKKILQDKEIRNGLELEGISQDQYMALNSYEKYDFKIKSSFDSFARTKLNDYIINLYRYNYNIIFGHLFRLLPYILSPAYKYKVQSPAMNIMFMALALMAIKNSYYHDRKSYELIINNLYEISNEIDTLDEKSLLLKFESIFAQNDFLKKNLKNHLKVVLSSLLLNTSAINFDNTKDAKEVHIYFTDKIYSFTENNKDLDENDIFNRSIVLLTEFFYKMEKIRYFDLSTFSIDYTLLTNKENRNSLKLFADSLMEACYIHLNILGSEIFFNGLAPSHIKTVENKEFNINLIGLDCTRNAKQNATLVESIIKNNSDYYNNSYNSYIAIINLYTSLVYSIHITLDNLSINNYNVGPYTSDNIKRPQSLWTILKRYAIHLTYINNNSYGIWNDVKIDSNNKNEIEKMMISHRIKFLLYGLHLKYWYTDGYFFYTNYKKLMINYNGDFQNVLKSINELYNSNPNKILKLFNDSNNIDWIPTPNIGLALAPMAGSYTITTVANCINYYIDNNEVIVNLIHHGLKDIMVGDSMSCIIKDRYDCIKPIISSISNKNKISLNNINGNFQVLFDDLKTSKYHEIALSANLSFIYKNIIKKHFIKNPNDCMALNSNNVNANYDETFFKQEDQISSYNISYSNYSWGYRVFDSILNSLKKNDYMKFINNYINLYRISIANFKTWHVKTEDDKKLNNYYKKFNGFSNMLSIFRKEYKNGLDRMINNKEKYSIFDKITRNIFTKNKFNNKNCIGNIFSVTYNKNSFEDNVVNNTAGGTVYGMYESPMLLLIYNNVDFNDINNYVDPTEENLFMLGRDLISKIYLVMKRLLVDLNFNGEPFDRLLDYYPNKTLDEVKDIFINDCAEQFYIITNNKYNQEINTLYNNIIEKGDMNRFISILAQFFDYDYIAKQVCQILDNQYNLNDEDATKFLNSSLFNRKTDILLYKSYCESIDKDQNQLNFIINAIINNKQGSLRKEKDSLYLAHNIVEDEKETFDKFKLYNPITIKNSTGTNYPTHINDASGIVNNDMSNNIKVLRYIAFNSIGITKENYDKMNKKDQEEYDKQVQEAKELIEKNNVQYNEKVTELEQELSQLRRVKKIANNEEVYKNIEQETYTQLSKESYEVIFLNKLNEICNTLLSIKEIALDNNHLLKELYKHNDNVNFEKVERVKESVQEEKEDEISISTEKPVRENEESDREYIQSDTPKINKDGSIDFFSKSGYKITVQKDFSAEPLQYDEQFENNHIYEGAESININQVENNEIEYEFNENQDRISYDKYIYVPTKYLLKVIPNMGFNQKEINIDEENNIISNKISKYKACKHNVPIYGINAKELSFPFDNVPIIFKQPFNNIIKDINDRILPINESLAQNIIEALEKSEIKDIWNSNMSHINRYFTIQMIYNKINNEE